MLVHTTIGSRTHRLVLTCCLVVICQWDGDAPSAEHGTRVACKNMCTPFVLFPFYTMMLPYKVYFFRLFKQWGSTFCDTSNKKRARAHNPGGRGGGLH